MANRDKYETETSASLSQYVFFSIGPRGEIEKRVQYTNISDYENTDNCAFGDWDEENQCIIDDSVTNNGDMGKVIATVIGTMYDYTNTYPERFIYFKGSSLTRTLMYGKIIFDYYDELIEDFYIFGITNVITNGKEIDEISTYSKREKDHYDAFMVKRR